MKESAYTGYYSMNTTDGSRVLHVPNLFVAYHFISNTKTQIIYCIRPDEVARALDSFLENSRPIQLAVREGLIKRLNISKKVVKQLEKLLERGQIEKAGKKVGGFAKAIFLDIIAEEVENATNQEPRDKRIVSDDWWRDGQQPPPYSE